MNQSFLTILILAGVAIFLILRLKDVLGTREGFEPNKEDMASNVSANKATKQKFEVIEGGPDHDIIDNVEAGSAAADSLAAIKRIEPSFKVSEFLEGARGAYEMILMSFERGELDEIKDFLAEDVLAAFVDVVADREDKGLKVESQFIGMREVKILNAALDRATDEAEITISFIADVTNVVKDQNGEIVEGNPTAVVKQKDVWTFSRELGADDPNWLLVATGA